MTSTGPIDFVYTWVDGSRPDYRTLLARYSEEPVDLNPERFRDHYSLLRYSLRSVQRFAPWFGNIVLFTCRPQVPDWLDTSHPRIRIVHHDEVIDPEYLPTFNCNVIESYLHRVPTSSNTFLYLNDDHLFGAPTALDDFLRGDRLQVMGTLFGERLPFRIFEQKNIIFSTGLVEHTPMAIQKEHWEAMLLGHREVLHRTRSHRFRQGDDLKMDRLYRYYLLSNRHTKSEAVPIWRLLRYHRFHKLTNHYERQRRKLASLRSLAPKFYCFNDDQGDHPDPRVVKLIQDFLEEQLPQKSDFER